MKMFWGIIAAKASPIPLYSYVVSKKEKVKPIEYPFHKSINNIKGKPKIKIPNKIIAIKRIALFFIDENNMSLWFIFSFPKFVEKLVK